MSVDRMRRVNEALREVISDGILDGLDTAGSAVVTVTSVDTSPDLRHALVYISSLDAEQQSETILESLEQIRPKLQHAVASQLHLKNTPKLKFELDPTVAGAARIYELIDRELSERRPDNE